MPHVRLIDPSGLCYEIASRRRMTLLLWFDEILPWAFRQGRPGIDDFEILWPKVDVRPMWAWKTGPPEDPDWSCDSRVLAQWRELRAKNGEQALAELVRIRAELEQELAAMPARTPYL